MQPRPSFDPELLLVIAVGVVAMLGVGWIFLTNDRSEPPIPPTLEPTVAAFEVSPSKTRILHPTPSATSTLEETPPTVTEANPDLYPGPPTETLPVASTLVTESRDSSVSPTPDQAFPPGKYDDTHPNIAYDRYWAFKMNSGTANAYKGTLHISTSIGNEISFRFTGQRIYLGYQRGRNFGTVTVMIDDQPYSFHEQAFDNRWLSPPFSPGTHSVRIIHENGESVNLDYIEVLG